MTDLVARVLLKADATGLVGQAREGKAAVDQLAAATIAAGTDAKSMATGTLIAARSVDELGSANRQAGAAAQALAGDQRQVLAATAELRSALDQATARTNALEAANGLLTRELREATNEAGRMATELRQAQEASAGLAGRVDVLETRLKGQTRAHREAGDEANRHQFAVRNLGQQFGDLGLSITGGISPARAFGQQAGQIGYAMSEMGGKAGAVGAFLTGPWGIALTLATAVIAPFVEELFKAGEAAEAAKIGADGLSDAQGVLGGIFDLTSGKIKSQNELLILNARLTAINLRGEAAKARVSSRETLDNSGKVSASDRVRGFFQAEGLFFNTKDDGLGGIGGALRGTDQGSRNARDLATVVKRLRDGKNTSQQVLAAAEKLDFTGTKVTREQFMQAIIDGEAAGRKDDVAAMIDSSLDSGNLAAGLRREGTKKRTPKPKSTAARDEFGRDAQDRIAAVTAQFDDTAPSLRKTNAEVAKLDDLIDDLSRKKPPNFEALIASAEQAKTVVRRGLIDNVAEAFAKPKTLADQARVAFGQLDAIAGDLEKRRPPNFESLVASVGEARAAIQDGLDRPLRDFVEQQQEAFAIGKLIAEGKTAEAEALREINRLEQQRGPLTEAQKDAVLATTQALAAQERQIERNRQRQQVYLNALGDMRSIVQAATQDFARGDLGQLIKSPKRLLDAFTSLKGAEIFDRMFEGAFSELKDQITGTSVVEDASSRMAEAVDAVSSQTRQTTGALADLQAAVSGVTDAVRGNASAGAGVAPSSATLPSAVGGAVGGGVANADGADIVVTGRRERVSPDKLFTEGLGKISTSIAGLFTNEDSAKSIGANIGKYAGRGLEGAATGTFVSGIANSLGLKLNGTGAQIGGAIGGITGLPGGQIIGSVLGGIAGSLFGGKPKEYGSSTIAIGNGEASAGTAIGKGSAEKETASALGGSVAQGLNQIAAALGGNLSGSASVSIGYRPGHKAGAYRVDTSGGGRVTGVEAFETEGEAIAFAIRDALADGAVKGLSTAVAKALQSSTDVDKAVAEALKVKSLETALGGVSGQLTAIFAQADTDAAERVRLAKAYGLDLLAVEKLNAEQRADLLDQTLKARVGSLKDLLANFTYGDLFEGSATDRRDAIQREIKDAEADADKGVEGAADRLAELYRQLVTTSAEAFGTAGPELAADRTAALAGVERAIKIEEDRVRAAAATQAATVKAIDTVATLTNEGNDLMVTQNDLLTRIAGAVEGSGAQGYPGPDLSLFRREAR